MATIYRVHAPDRQIHTFEGPDGLNEEQAIRLLYQLRPESFKEPKQSTTFGELARSTERMISSSGTGLAGIFNPNAAAEAGARRGDKIDAEYGEGPSLERFKDIYEREGALPALKGLAGDIPRGIASILPTALASMGTAKAGAMLGALGGPAAPVTVPLGAALGAFAPSMLQHFGSNLERAASEDLKEKRAVDVDAGAAATAAAGQAALDTGSAAFAIGGKLLSKLLGIPAKQMGTATAEATFKAVLKGGARGSIEIPTEVAQQALERWQAGLPLTSEDALAEYGSTAYSTAVGAVPLGGYAGYKTNNLNRAQQAQREAANLVGPAGGPTPPAGGPGAPDAPTPPVAPAGPGTPPAGAPDTTGAQPTPAPVEPIPDPGEPPRFAALSDVELQGEIQAAYREPESFERDTDIADLVYEFQRRGMKLPEPPAEFQASPVETPEAPPAPAPQVPAPTVPEPTVRPPRDRTSGSMAPPGPQGPVARPAAPVPTAPAPVAAAPAPRPGEITLAEIDSMGLDPGVNRWMRNNVAGKTPDEVRAMVEAKPSLAEGRGTRAQALREIIAPQPAPMAEPAAPAAQPAPAPVQETQPEPPAAPPAQPTPVPQEGTQLEQPPAPPAVAPIQPTPMPQPVAPAPVAAQSLPQAEPETEEQRLAAAARVAEQMRALRNEGRVKREAAAAVAPAPVPAEAPRATQTEAPARAKARAAEDVAVHRQPALAPVEDLLGKKEGAKKPTPTKSAAASKAEVPSWFKPPVEPKRRLRKAPKSGETTPATEAPAERREAETPEARAEKAWEDVTPEWAPRWADLDEKQRKQWTELVRDGTGSLAAANRITGASTQRFSVSDDAPLPPRRWMPEDEVNKIVDRVLATMKRYPKVEVVDTIDDVPGIVVPEDVHPTAALVNGVAYLFRNRLATELDVEKALFHEAFHAGVWHTVPRAVFEERMRALAATDARVREYAERWKQSKDGLKQKEELSPGAWNALAIEEGLADVAEEIATGERGGSAERHPSVMALARWFIGWAERFGMRKLAQHLRRMQYTEAEKFVIDTLGTGDGLGADTRLSAPNTKNFRSWFGKSKIVNADGTPKVMYHGTARDITAFRAKQAGAIFVTPEPRFASSFADYSLDYMVDHYEDFLSAADIKGALDRAGEKLEAQFSSREEAAPQMKELADNPQNFIEFRDEVESLLETNRNIMPVYVKAEKPFDYDVAAHANAVSVEAGLTRGERNMLAMGVWSTIENPKVQAAIRKLGFDSFYITEAGVKNLAVYEPTQIKSAIGNNGEYDGTNPDIRFATSRAPASPAISPQAQQMLNAMQGASQAGARSWLRRLMPNNQTPMAQTPVALTEQIDRVRTLTVDNMATAESRMTGMFNNAVRSAQFGLNPMLRMRQAADASKLMLEFFQRGAIAFSQAHGVWRVEDVAGGKAPSKVFELVDQWAKAHGVDFKKAQHDAGRILEAVRLRELRASNAQNGTSFVLHMTDNEIDTLTQTYDNDPLLKSMTDAMDAPRKALIDQLVAVGRITPEVGAMWKETIGYVPFDRVKDDSRYFKVQRRTGRGLAQYGQLPELVGSERRPVDNVFTNYINTLGWMVSQVLRTDAVSHTVHTLEQLGVANRRGTAPPTADQAERAVRVFEGGEEIWYILPTAYDAMAFNDRTMPIPTVFRALGKVSNVLRRAITAVPTFSAKQIMEDAQRAAMHSGIHDVTKLTARIMANFAYLTKSEVAGQPNNLAREAGRLGLTGEYDWEDAKPAMSLLKDLGYEKRGTFGALMHKLEGITRASDLAVRQAIYDQTVEETQDHALAQMRAREIINFRRRGYGGNNGVLSIMIQTVPFFNAYLQGMDVLYRSLTGRHAASGANAHHARKMFYSRAAVLVSIASLYALMHADDDDDDYEDMSLDKRDKTWLLGRAGDVPLAIPVPTELGVLFKVAPERVIQYYKREGTPEQQTAAEAITTYLRAGYEAYAGRLNPIPQALKPFAEIMTNYSFFTGRALEGTYQKTLEPQERAASTTSEFAKAVAKFVYEGTEGKVKVSPISIDTLMTGYLGTTAAIVTMTLDAAINPDKLDRPLYRMAGIAPFTYDPIGTRHLDEFYDLREEVASAQTTLREIGKRNVEEARMYVERNRERLMFYKMVNSSLQELEKIRAAKAWLATKHGADSFASNEERSQHLERLREYEQNITGWVRQAKAAVGK